MTPGQHAAYVLRIVSFLFLSGFAVASLIAGELARAAAFAGLVVVWLTVRWLALRRVR
jgi:hypothetical protein